MAAVRHLGFVVTSQYCIAGHIFVVQILSWDFMLIGVVVSEILSLCPYSSLSFGVLHTVAVQVVACVRRQYTNIAVLATAGSWLSSTVNSSTSPAVHPCQFRPIGTWLFVCWSNNNWRQIAVGCIQGGVHWTSTMGAASWTVVVTNCHVDLSTQWCSRSDLVLGDFASWGRTVAVQVVDRSSRSSLVGLFLWLVRKCGSFV